jgi:hypothetical protein
MQFRLRLVKQIERPADPLPRAVTMEEKRARAIAYLRKRGIYVLDRNSRAPKWKA